MIYHTGSEHANHYTIDVVPITVMQPFTPSFQNILFQL